MVIFHGYVNVYRRVQYHTVSLCSLYNQTISSTIPVQASQEQCLRMVQVPWLLHHDHLRALGGTILCSRSPLFVPFLGLWCFYYERYGFHYGNMIEKSMTFYDYSLLALLATQFFLSRLSRLAHWWYSRGRLFLPSGYVKIAIENGPFIDGLPNKNGWIFYSYVNVYQRSTILFERWGTLRAASSEQLHRSPRRVESEVTLMAARSRQSEWHTWVLFRKKNMGICVGKSSP